MNRPTLASLVLVNIALLGILALVSFSSPNPAVASTSSGKRAEYVAVTGYIAGSKTPILWMVNQASQEVVAIQFDAQKNQIVGFGYRSMSNDAISLRRNRP